jgi:hypothetical protein
MIIVYNTCSRITVTTSAFLPLAVLIKNQTAIFVNIIMLMRKFLFVLLSQWVLCIQLHAQDTTVQNHAASFSRKVYGYLSFIIPVVVVDKEQVTTDFTKATTIGFPIGVNILYSERFGFSYEFTPTLRFSSGASKMSNLLFDPGPMFRFSGGFTIITRLAFETSGRYGVTPVFNKVLIRSKGVNYFLAVSLPARFGNEQPASIGGNVQVGFIFN